MSETSLRDEMAELKEIMLATAKKKKVRQFRMPMKAKVNKRKLMKGYVTVQTFRENRGVTFSREPIIDGTVKLVDTFHAVEDLDIFFFKGRPFVMIAKDKLNPINPVSKGAKETYGQKFVMARMKSDAIKAAGKRMGVAALLGFGVLAIVGYYLVSGGSIS